MRLSLGIFTAAMTATIASAAPFTDITAESGVSPMVAKHYQQFPKWWLSGLTLVDLDGDGFLDLHLASHSGPANPAMAALNDGKGHFEVIDPQMSIARGPRHRADLPYPGGEIRLACDLNEDGKLDLLCSWHDGGGVLYMNESKRPDLVFKPSDLLDPFSRATALADIDGDGRADYLADERSNISAILGNSKKTSIPALKESCAIPVDLDGDGQIDLLVSQRGYNPTRRLILHNDGKMKFSDITKASGLDADGGSIHGVGDFNHDGWPDLICVEGDALQVYLNDGKGHFTKKAGAIRGFDRVPNKPTSTNWGGAVTSDLDNDGKADVLINGRYFLYILRGAGDGTFDVMNEKWGITTLATSAVDEGLCFGDINNDGALDLVTCARGANEIEKSVAVLRNDLPRQHWLRIRPIGATANRSATGAKIRITEPATGKLLWYEQIAIWGRQSFHSYYATSPAERHFGLGERQTADVSVEFLPSRKIVERKGVKADSTVEVHEN